MKTEKEILEKYWKLVEEPNELKKFKITEEIVAKQQSIVTKMMFVNWIMNGTEETDIINMKHGD